ncbi:carbohydrate ABC transporter substrate-binding protein, CUT1 family [Clostridium aceticum]|uniref:Carbohydrate ABC transporter substrate-binding protein, CUT1 family n=1 Tax=Clostridium aceticum TaxID=84022 RepID=A0A0D8IB42_9CLOT|nr:extracellular solute-binding protein [Clostridium aceticum]AKL96709.1 carbohydrate ABC transporter substrate-binding protein, CUT1 family [Clostridium aceticum]KJF27478.1 ABC transporter substrate-binding protein [Clostridium aceticum]
MKKIKKTWLKIFIYIVLILFIAGGPFYLSKFHPRDRDYNVTKKEAEWRGVISFWDYPRLDRKTGTNFRWIYEKIRAFEKENPGVYIDFKPLDWERGGIKLDTAIKMGNPPDVLPIGSDYSILSKEVLQPLDPYLTAEEVSSFKEDAIKAVSYDGHIWGLPWMMSTYTMVLNLDLFNERGVEPPVDGNWTYEEFIEKLQQLTYDSKGNGKIDHFGFNSFIQSGYYNIWGILLSDGGEVINNNFQYAFYDEGALTGLEKLIDLKHKYKVTPPDFGENTSNAAWTNFYKDKNIAVYPVGTWALNVLENLKNEGVGFDYQVANYPTGKLGNPLTMTSGIGAYGIYKQEDREKLEVCIKFLKYLADEKHQEELNRLGVFPVKKEVGNIYQDDPMMTQIYENAETAKIIPPHPYWKEIDRILQNEIRMGVLENRSSQQVIKEAQEKVEVMLNAAEK